MTRDRSPAFIKTMIMIVVIVTIILYTIFNSRIFREGPQIQIQSPQNGSTLTDSPLVQIIGTAVNIARLTINDRQIYTDEQGLFAESLLLNSGYNIIRFTAEDKFGRTEQQVLELVYTGTKPSLITNTEDPPDLGDEIIGTSTDTDETSPAPGEL